MSNSVLTQFDADTGVMTVTFNRPEARNSLTPEMVEDLKVLFAELPARTDVRVVLMRSRGGHFCAGADLKGVFAGAAATPEPGQPDPVVLMNRGFGELLRAAEAIPQVLITVCEGGVLGGGFGLACVSDIALAHVATKFGMPETSRGLPPAQIAPFVVQRIGLTQARRLVLTSAQFDGQEALRLGLVHEVFSDEATLADALARNLTHVLRCAPSANARTKAIVLSVGQVDPDAVLDQAAEHFAACARGSEAPEGIGAFMQKRAASWARTVSSVDVARLLTPVTAQEISA